MLNSDRFTWQNTFHSKQLMWSLVISVFLLITWAFMAPMFFEYIQQRNGVTLDDPVLKTIDARDVSIFVFLLLYTLIIAGVVYLFFRPYFFVVAVQAYAVLTFFRLLSILLVPLEDPYGIIPLSDPFVDHLFYQKVITKDLFFSGHTSIVFLLAFCCPSRMLQWLLIIGGIAIGGLLLIQHAHYFIDVLVAPLVAYLAYRISRKLLPPPPTTSA